MIELKFDNFVYSYEIEKIAFLCGWKNFIVYAHFLCYWHYSMIFLYFHEVKKSEKNNGPRRNVRGFC